MIPGPHKIQPNVLVSNSYANDDDEDPRLFENWEQ
jgi:hypothetical protein